MQNRKNNGQAPAHRRGRGTSAGSSARTASAARRISSPSPRRPRSSSVARPRMSSRRCQRAAAHAADRTTVVIGKDTRLSGYMLENALAAGVMSLGADVLLIGPAPHARRGLHHALAARGCGHRAQRLAQSVRGQWHQVFPPRRIQARRRDRETHRAARLQRRDRVDPPHRREDRPSHAHRRRARSLRGVRQAELSARADARKAAHRRGCREWRGLQDLRRASCANSEPK